jgi:hypothetical protein
MIYFFIFKGREKLMKNLMDNIKVDSYGGCLKNQFSHPSEHMKGNIELFANYKFVIAIENSNCEDYVTEKLVHAIASGSIPIVASYNGKPDYSKFLPKNSYINIYDFESVPLLVEHLKLVASNKNEYEKYFTFKLRHNYTNDYLHTLPLENLIELSKQIIGPDENFFKHLIAKEKSENKLCKIARYLFNTPNNLIDEQIKKNQANRPSNNDACLPSKHLSSHFKINSNFVS